MHDIFPFIKEHGSEILSNKQPHCHIISEDKLPLAIKVINEIHKIQLDPEITLWQVGIKHGIRIICGIDGDDKNNICFYPLFVDNHHCIYEDDKFRGKYKKICKFQFSNAKCAPY